MAANNAEAARGHPDIACHVISSHINSRFLSSMAAYDVASDILPALGGGRGAGDHDWDSAGVSAPGACALQVGPHG